MRRVFARFVRFIGNNVDLYGENWKKYCCTTVIFSRTLVLACIAVKQPGSSFTIWLWFFHIKSFESFESAESAESAEPAEPAESTESFESAESV